MGGTAWPRPPEAGGRAVWGVAERGGAGSSRAARIGAVVHALVFDFDGLIVDTEVRVYRAWAEVYEHHGERLTIDFWSTIIGYGSDRFDPMADLERRLG